MIPKRLSASSIKVFETCSARWRAEYMHKAPDSDNEAALLGTICHEALEVFVNAKRFDAGSWVFLENAYHVAYWKHLDHGVRYDEGLAMCKRWWERTYEHLASSANHILANEDWKQFLVPTSAGDLPFVYIIDRLDRDVDTGVVTVIDYKTVARPVSPEQLHGMIQARLYAMATQMEFPDEPGIWVEFDLLRWEPVGTYFTRDESRDTYRWLVNKAEEIIADDGVTERINPECRFCVRRHACSALDVHIEVGGIQGIPLEAAAAQLPELQERHKALGVLVGDLEKIIVDELEGEGVLSMDAGGVEVSLTARKSRKLDQNRASKIIGHDLMAEYGKLNISDVDALLKGDLLADDEKSQLRQAIRVQFGAPKPVVHQLPLDE